MTALPSYIDPELFAAFCEMRRAYKKVPFTARAELLVVRKLMRMHDDGFCTSSALEASTINGWRDVYPKDRLAKPGAIDPALAKLDADTRNAAPPPEEVRRRMAEITGRMKA